MPIVVMIKSYNGITHPNIECVEEATGKDQIVTPNDRQPDSSFLQAPLWRNDELSEYQ